MTPTIPDQLAGLAPERAIALAATTTNGEPMTTRPIDAVAAALPPTQPIDITAYLPNPIDEPSG